MGSKLSGHRGHKGRKGKRGGSLPSKGIQKRVKGAGKATERDVAYIQGIVDEVIKDLPPEHLEGYDIVASRSAKRAVAGKVGQLSTRISVPRRDRNNTPLSKRELTSIVRHEIGHQVFSRVLTTEQRENWTKAGKQIRLSVSHPKVARYFPYLDDASQMKVSKNLRDLSFGGELFAELYNGYYGYKRDAIKELFPARFKRLEAL